MPLVSPENDPYCDLQGPPGALWLDIPEGPELHRAVVGLYEGMHPYADRIQTQTPAGRYLTAERGLRHQQTAYPTAAAAAGSLESGGLDPYAYILILHKPDSTESFHVPLQQTSDGTVIVSGARVFKTGGAEASRALDESWVISLAKAALGDIRKTIPNTSEMAGLLSWSELQGPEALSFQDLVDAAMDAAQVGPQDLQTQMAVVTPKRTASMPWKVEHLIIGPLPEPESRIPDTQLNALITFATGHLALSTAVYDANRRPLTVTLRHAFRGNRLRFLTSQQREKAMAALEYQLDPSHVGVRLDRLQ